MSELVLTREETRQVDKRAVEQWGLSSLVLMENAGRGAADSLLQLDRAPRQVSIFCGKGNNGGDGFVMARHLHLRGVSVEVFIFHDPETFSADALSNFKILKKCGIACHSLPAPSKSTDLKAQLESCCHKATWLVDALLGTGSSGPPRPPLDQVISWINQASAQRLALDVPSGLDCDTAEVARVAVQADQTFTFAAAKPGLLMPRAAGYVGQLKVCDIGLPRKLLEACANSNS